MHAACMHEHDRYIHTMSALLLSGGQQVPGAPTPGVSPVSQPAQYEIGNYIVLIQACLYIVVLNHIHSLQ